MTASAELLRARTRPWLEPISEDKPSGVQAKHDPAYEAVSTEVAKLESPASDAVDWAGVVRGSGQLLQHTTKDLWLASYLAYGMYMTEGLSGALTGMVVLAEVTDQYWPTLFPDAKRLRGRANAVTWFVERMGRVLPSVKVTAADSDLLGQLSEAAARLAELSRARFEGQGPAFGPLLEGVMRLRASLQTPEPAPVPVAAPTAPTPAQSPVAAQAPAPALSLPPPSAELASPEAATDFLRNVGGSLVSAAGLVRRANTADPLAYRMLRTGLWLHLSQPPAPGANARTSLPPFPPALRERLERMATHARWAELLEEAESALVQHRFALELQRHVVNALAGLGATHAGAREALVLELAALLRRMPGVVDLVASDGTPLTDAATKQWLQTEVASRASPASQPAGTTPRAARIFLPAPQFETPATGTSAALQEEARILLEAGKPEEAFQRLQGAVNAATTGRARFIARLSLARMCANSGNLLLARTLYELLDEECSARQLDAWDPALAAACLEGFLTCTFAQTNFTGRLEMDLHLRYRRLAQLDAPAALRVRVERLEATAESAPDTTAS
ncbi:type VI secretion system protein TssA [Corallococcus praedator]|uniref:Type VI secretion system protein TssA n=1 Tax=Corallococcus praedator TaxID=2316724 RepID=A0ABX9QIG0_9BACT|nr:MULTISPECIES: type VI secretion system protein TssA [Corallococcus]RKH29473.1 type VI secretion system protein TssA [Corallococcus sp. CA031C]RKI08736.1 type VI secretion system protein TssA [Corallococcus praedator]